MASKMGVCVKVVVMELSTVKVKSAFPTFVRLIVIGFWVSNFVFHCGSEVKL